MWRSVVWYRRTSISEEPNTSFFRVEITISGLDPWRPTWKVTNTDSYSILYFTTFSLSSPMKGCLVKDKFEGIWKEAVVTSAWYCPEMCLTKLQAKQTVPKLRLEPRTFSIWSYYVTSTPSSSVNCNKRLMSKLSTNFGFSENSRRLFTEEVETTSVQQTAHESGVRSNNVQTVPDTVRVLWSHSCRQL